MPHNDVNDLNDVNNVNVSTTVLGTAQSPLHDLSFLLTHRSGPADSFDAKTC